MTNKHYIDRVLVHRSLEVVKPRRQFISNIMNMVTMIYDVESNNSQAVVMHDRFGLLQTFASDVCSSDVYFTGGCLQNASNGLAWCTFNSSTLKRLVIDIGMSSICQFCSLLSEYALFHTLKVDVLEACVLVDLSPSLLILHATTLGVSLSVNSYVVATSSCQALRKVGQMLALLLTVSDKPNEAL